MNAAYQRLKTNWVYGGFLMAFVLLALAVPLLADAPLALVLIYLHLPMYQLHQYEEHDADRFRVFVNSVLGKGRELLTLDAVFFINTVLVWALFTAVFLASSLVDLGYGLIVAYATLLNGIVHVAQALVLRRYNPGLGTAVLAFLPVSATAIWTLSRTEGIELADHTLGFTAGVAIHAAIVVHVLLRIRRLKSAEREAVVQN
ncbi:MAG: HXXEE domain-containing protein [Planctomycetota bacterium]